FWSLGVLIDELGAIYPAIVAETPTAALPAPSAQYADFVRWQERLLAGSEGQRLETYWRSALAGGLPGPSRGPDRARPAVQTDRGAVHRFRLDSKLSAQLRDFAKSEGATLYAVLLAAYQSFLHRITGQDDILVGSPVAGRSRPEFATVVGY